VPTCTNGHYLSGGTAFCGVCGDDVRPRCDQGHPGKVGARFCATCGGPIAAPGPARVTGPGLPGSVRPTADDMTPLLTTLPAAGPPPSSSTLNGQLPVSYPAPPGPSLGDSPPAAPWDRQAERTTGSGFAPSPQARPPQAGGGPGRPPATIELPRTGTASPAPGGRHRGGPPPGADRGGQAPEVGETPTPRTRSRRVLILGLTLGLVVVAGGGHAAASSREAAGRGRSHAVADPSPGVSHPVIQRHGRDAQPVIGRGGSRRMDLSQANRSAGLRKRHRHNQFRVLRNGGDMLRGRQRRQRTGVYGRELVADSRH